MALTGSRGFKVEASYSLVPLTSVARPEDLIEAAQNHFVMRDDDDRGAADIGSLRTGVVNQQSKEREYNNRDSVKLFSRQKVCCP